jgi:phosphoglycerol transferase MdoB-like AlkP superfamily enzyme
MQSGEVYSYNFKELAGTFVHGFKLDLSATCYLLLLPLLAAIPGLYFTGKWYRIFLKTYSFFMIILATLIIVSDADTYSYWGYRLEFSSVEYLKTPKDALASLKKGEFLLLLMAFLLMSSFFIFFCNKIINRFFSSPERIRHFIPGFFFFLLLTASLIIPIRGGTGVAPLNVGAAYFSESLFLNHTAINEVWNFGHSAAYRKPVRNPYQFGELSKALDDVRYLTKYSGTTRKVLNTERPNILLIVLESFGSYLTDHVGSDTVITPRFNEYTSEGIYFTNLYAAGSRTDKAIPAIFSGYPNLPTIQVLREPKKIQSMPGIVKLLDSAGYKSSFWYGGDINFADLNSFIITTGFRQKITIKNFDRTTYNSKWGVHDGVLFERLEDSLSKAKEPFIYSALTLSSHEPFEVPMEPVFKGHDELSRFRNSVYYTDRSLGEFLDKAKKTDWWKNTLVVIVADHCRRYSENVPVYSEEIFKIPMLWLGGALSCKNIRVSKIANQYDIPLTIANQLDMKSSFTFSKDLLSEKSASFAFYTYNEGFVFITDTTTSIFDIKLKNNILLKGVNPGSAERYGKAFLQVLFDDYLKR